MTVMRVDWEVFLEGILLWIASEVLVLVIGTIGGFVWELFVVGTGLSDEEGDVYADVLSGDSVSWIGYDSDAADLCVSYSSDGSGDSSEVISDRTSEVP